MIEQAIEQLIELTVGGTREAQLKTRKSYSKQASKQLILRGHSTQ
jgi:hypothetical protein